MYNFQYVSKKAVAPKKQDLIAIINEVQNIVRDKFTFQFTFVGSSKYNMITCDLKSNIGFDFDVNIEVNDDDEDYTPKQIRNILMKAFDEVVGKYGYDFCENSTRVLTVKVKDREHSKILHSCDFAIVNNCDDGRQQYILFNKADNSYSWEYQPLGFEKLPDKIKWLKENDLWGELRENYLYKKNTNISNMKHSRSIFAESINEVCQRNGYND